ncbi:hypothetical protein LTR37_003969 [Vermiconidia calcicola]|uniref:Uncharacterized protein n=1 Tax=Vermiconidia calcicola TaxID=1690605 RepID=A0ACC3NNZ5_9PEZI|nr:hypothetical protein LTR37_003969 [Vermiconidia calcicola]
MNPDTWPANALATYLTETHLENSPTTPFSYIEFQGGSFDPWGGWGFAQCLELVGYQFERVFYKNNFASAVTIFSIYMTYGGTNWGNLGHPGGYTSYDYAAVIKENLMVDREKYSEAKLEANFVVASPAYLTSVPGNLSNTSYTTTSRLSVTPLLDDESDTKFYVLRHANYSDRVTTPYKLTIQTSEGDLTIPQLDGELTLHGRDSKVHVSDYVVGGHNVLYSSAEIFTWQSYGSKTILIVYGGEGEQHELAVSNGGQGTLSEDDGVQMGKRNGATVLNWSTSSSRRVVQLECGLTIYILDRNSAYNYWVLKLPDENGLYAPSGQEASTVIVKAGYLMRNATMSGDTLNLVGDFNATTDVEVIGGAPVNLATLNINSQASEFTQDEYGVASTSVSFHPDISVPLLSSLNWKYIDSLPEIKPGYDDSLWRNADLPQSYDDKINITTPVSLLGADYGFLTGTLLFRGHFTANGNENDIFLETQGGSAFGSSVWIGDTYVGSWAGNDAAANGNDTYTLPNLQSGTEYVITVVVDQQGMDENYVVGENEMKSPRGILRYRLSGHAATDVSWKITGNLHGEDYEDKTRGPLNEGGLYAERQGYHLPGAPIDSWSSSGGPTEGISSAGIAFYGAELELDLPAGWDVPLSFTFTNATSADALGSSASAYHVQLYVNGFQYGKYKNHIGPQTSFPVPQGIWNYHGTNYIAFALWSLEPDGAKVEGLELTVNGRVKATFTLFSWVNG